MAGIIDETALKYGLDPEMLHTFARIESGGNPRSQTGSYKGLFQLSDEEFRKHGGTGDIFDPQANTAAAAAKIAAESKTFENQYGRAPTASELYLIHQQGPAGYAAHSANPDQPAWMSMASTGEGKQKGQEWAKRAIWGNVPDNLKGQFGNVNNITSQQFMDLWRQKVEGQPAAPIQLAQGPSQGPLQASGMAGSPTAPVMAPQQGGMPDFSDMGVPTTAASFLNPQTPQLPPLRPFPWLRRA
jgi:hypothetical protein